MSAVYIDSDAWRASYHDAITWGTPVTPTPTVTSGGGDDVPRRRRKSPDRGFDLQAWRDRQQDFEGTVREVYETLMRGPDSHEADQAVTGHRGRAGIDWPALARDDRALAELLELRQRASDEEEEIIVMLLH